VALDTQGTVRVVSD
jgi:hypothetical protein